MPNAGDASEAASGERSTNGPIATLAYATPPATDRGLRPLPALVLLALALRLVADWTHPITDASLLLLPDQGEYLTAGGCIRHGQQMYVMDWQFGELYAYRMPGYPMLIAACGASRQAIQVVQAVLDASSVVAVYLIGRRLLGSAAAYVAGGAVACNPYLIYFSTLLLSETLFTAMVAWAVYCLLSRSVAGRCAGILLLLLGLYVRPSALGLGVCAAAATFAVGPLFRDRLFRAGAAAVIAGLVLIALLTPWAVRNKSIFGTSVWTTTNDGFTAFDSFNPAADGSSNQMHIREWLAAHEAGDGQAADSDLEEVTRSRLLQRWAWDYARTHPLRDVELAFLKLGRFWSPVPLSADFGGKWLYVLVGGLYCVPLFAFAAIGVIKGGLGRRATFTLLLPALYFSAVHSIAVGSLRYRVPCDVPLAVLAAAGVTACLPKRAAA